MTWWIRRTILHWAGDKKLVKICQLIMDYLEDKNPLDDQGHSVFWWAALTNNEEICQLIIQNIEDKSSLLLTAINLKKSKLCKNLLQNNNIRKNRLKNIINEFGETILHLAAEWGNLEVFKLLIENMDDKNPINSIGDSPFNLAAENGHLDICKFIIENVEDRSSLLLTAIDLKNSELCKILLKNKRKTYQNCTRKDITRLNGWRSKLIGFDNYQRPVAKKVRLE